MKFSREKAYAIYEANKYRMTLGSFNGTKGLGMFKKSSYYNMYGVLNP